MPQKFPLLATEPLFRYSRDKAELFHPAFAFRAALHNINPHGVNAGVTENVRQFRYIFFHPAIGIRISRFLPLQSAPTLRDEFTNFPNGEIFFAF